MQAADDQDQLILQGRCGAVPFCRWTLGGMLPARCSGLFGWGWWQQCMLSVFYVFSVTVTVTVIAREGARKEPTRGSWA